MGRRTDEYELRRVLTQQEVHNLRRSLRDMEPLRITHIYQEAWQACRMAVHELPSPEAIQVMVQAWKELWRVSVRRTPVEVRRRELLR